MPSSRNNVGSPGSKKSTLTSSNGQPRKDAGAERGQEAAQTRTEPAKEAPGDRGDGRARAGTQSDDARNLRGGRPILLIDGSTDKAPAAPAAVLLHQRLGITNRRLPRIKCQLLRGPLRRP
jgi:hypothetical protein